MKLAVRVLAFCVVIAGFAAASMSSATPKHIIHQAANGIAPFPRCFPNCGTKPSGGVSQTPLTK